MSDAPTLVRFEAGWEEDGLGKDGLPNCREVVKIQLDRPPYLSITRTATEVDFDDYPEPYLLFQKDQASRKPKDREGYPLAYWPVVNPAELRMLAARDVYTVQQLGRLAARSSDTLPPQILELAKRAKEMVELHKEVGKYEAIITELKGQLKETIEQLKEANKTIAAQLTMIDTLKMRVA